MSESAEDQRAAANIAVSLSSYVIAASLAVLGAQAAIVTFVLDKRDAVVVFYLVSIAACIALVVSVISGGKGITEIYKKGHAGDWAVRTLRGYFNWQAVLSLLGVLLVVLSAFLGAAKREISALPVDYEMIRTNVKVLQQEVKDLKVEVAALSSEADPLDSDTGPSRSKKR